MNTLLRYHPTTTVAFTLNQYSLMRQAPIGGTRAGELECVSTAPRRKRLVWLIRRCRPEKNIVDSFHDREGQYVEGIR
jgi:hypothetical protein